MQIPIKRIYFYPNSKYVPIEHSNPYSSNFMSSLSKIICVTNKDKPTTRGIIDIFASLSEFDGVIFNWLENIPDKKFGKFQSILLYFLLLIMKFRKKKIIWVLHNKISHSKKNFFWKKYIFRLMLKKSNYIITHAKDGVRYVQQNYPYALQKVNFFHHPVLNVVPKQIDEQPEKYDILIWGTVSPYKGVDKFLEILQKNDSLTKYKILIAGKFTSTELYNRVSGLISDNITLINEYISEEELKKYMQQSKLILFTYNADSVLSSGALIDSLYSYKNILGPNVGAFSDLALENIVYTYNTIEEVSDKLNRMLSENSEVDVDNYNKFMDNNKWDNFTKKFYSSLFI